LSHAVTGSRISAVIHLASRLGLAVIGGTTKAKV
jgi:hypothetical protein